MKRAGVFITHVLSRVVLWIVYCCNSMGRFLRTISRRKLAVILKKYLTHLRQAVTFVPLFGLTVVLRRKNYFCFTVTHCFFSKRPYWSDFTWLYLQANTEGKKLAITWPKHSMKEALTETNKAQVLIAADVSIAATLSRLENVRVQLELIQEDTNNLREDFKEISDRICTLAASCQEQGFIILKRRSKA